MTSIRSTSERPSIHESFHSVAGRANFDALAACGVNAQLELEGQIDTKKTDKIELE